MRDLAACFPERAAILEAAADVFAGSAVIFTACRELDPASLPYIDAQKTLVEAYRLANSITLEATTALFVKERGY